MFNLGLTQNFKNFIIIFKKPKALIVGLFCQMILLPIIASIIAYFSNLPPEFKLGLLLVAICPGGATSNLLNYLLKGNVALSISLTAINSLLVLFTIPFALFYGMQIFLAHGEIIVLPYWETMVNIFLMIVVPVIAGILYRRWKENSAYKIENTLKYVSIILLAFVFGFAIILNKGGEKSLVDYYLQVTPYVILLNFAGMTAGFLVSKLYKFKKDILITIPIEVGLQNSTLAITLAVSATFLNSPLTAVPATVYGMFTFFTTLLFGFLIKRFVKE